MAMLGEVRRAGKGATVNWRSSYGASLRWAGIGARKDEKPRSRVMPLSWL